MSVNVELEGLADAIVQRIKQKTGFSHIFSESDEGNLPSSSSLKKVREIADRPSDYFIEQGKYF